MILIKTSDDQVPSPILDKVMGEEMCQLHY